MKLRYLTIETQLFISINKEETARGPVPLQGKATFIGHNGEITVDLTQEDIDNIEALLRVKLIPIREEI